jgi:hypothetical protein
VLLPLSLYVDSFSCDNFTINYGCLFVFIPEEVTTPLRRIHAVSYETEVCHQRQLSETAAENKIRSEAPLLQALCKLTRRLVIGEKHAKKSVNVGLSLNRNLRHFDRRRLI